MTVRSVRLSLHATWWLAGTGLRVGHYAGLVFLHANFFRTALDGHVFVDKTNAAFLSGAIAGLLASVTVSIAARKHRNIQTNSFRQLRAEGSAVFGKTVGERDKEGRRQTSGASLAIRSMGNISHGRLINIAAAYTRT